PRDAAAVGARPGSRAMGRRDRHGADLRAPWRGHRRAAREPRRGRRGRGPARQPRRPGPGRRARGEPRRGPRARRDRALAARQPGLAGSASAVGTGARLEDIFDQIQAGETATLNLIVKADVTGSLEAVTESLKKLERDEVKLSFVHRGVGGITENDIQLAAASTATIIGFNVRPDRKARELAEAEGGEIRTYPIIHQHLEDIQAAMEG